MRKMIEQLSVSLENEPGQLARLSSLIGEGGSQIYGYTISETSDFAIARLVCDRPHETAKRVADLGYHVRVTPVLAVLVDDVPGGLGRILSSLASVELNVEYAYCILSDGRVVDVMCVTGDPVPLKLSEVTFKTLEPEDVYQVDAD